MTMEEWRVTAAVPGNVLTGRTACCCTTEALMGEVTGDAVHDSAGDAARSLL